MAREEAGHRFVGLHHEHFNNLVGEGIVFRLGVNDVAIGIHDEFDDGKIEDDHAGLQAALANDAREAVHADEKLADFGLDRRDVGIDGGFQEALGIGLAFAGGFGLPRWALKFLKTRREKNLLRALPDAVDVIVRGIKAGLPLFDSIKVVAADAPEPLKSEFMAIIETQAIGMPLGEACTRLYERMPVPEANFFGIVIAIQQKSGGNLSEALGNLSKVLRDRKKMAEKIQAMSMEAKASAGIIGSLPPIVMLLVYLSTPDYIALLWTHPTGQLMLCGCVVWMSIGVFVMKKMINFDF